MVKFAKNGSDATTGAVKLARAYTGKDLVVRCANKPFFSTNDWFIGSTVVTRGIPKEVQNLTLKFEYNNLIGLEKIFAENFGKIACVILEPVEFAEAREGYVEGMKTLCEKNGALLIFDEVVSGFRFHLGGIQTLFGVAPHLSAFGKAMANGFSCSFLAGRRDVMELGGIDHDQEKVFLLSTTHGGETHCMAAAKASIAEIKKHGIIEYFWRVGGLLQDGVRKLAEELGVTKYVRVSGYPCRPAFAFCDESGEVSQVARTLFLQETVARGLLMPYAVPSWAHKEEHIKFALDCIADAFQVMKSAAEGKGMLAQIEGAVIKPVFRKFN